MGDSTVVDLIRYLGKLQTLEVCDAPVSLKDWYEYTDGAHPFPTLKPHVQVTQMHKLVCTPKSFPSLVWEAIVRENPEVVLCWALRHSRTWPAITPRSRRMKAWLQYLWRTPWTRLEQEDLDDGESEVSDWEKEEFWSTGDASSTTLGEFGVGDPLDYGLEYNVVGGLVVVRPRWLYLS